MQFMWRKKERIVLGVPL